MRLKSKDQNFHFQYTFAQDPEDDGIRLSVHQSTVSQLSQGQLEWMVPGVFVDKIIQLIKSLPKRLRRNFVPAAESARIIAEQLKGQYRQESFSRPCAKLYLDTLKRNHGI